MTNEEIAALYRSQAHTIQHQRIQQQLQNLQNQLQNASGMANALGGLGPQTTPPAPAPPPELTLASREENGDVHCFTIQLRHPSFEIIWSSHHPKEELALWRDLALLSESPDNMACGCLKTLRNFIENAWGGGGKYTWVTATSGTWSDTSTPNNPYTFYPSPTTTTLPQIITSSPLGGTSGFFSNLAGSLSGAFKLFTKP